MVHVNSLEISSALKTRDYIFPPLSIAECSAFPLSSTVIAPNVSVFHPTKCGQLSSYTGEGLRGSGCLEDKTIIVIGDSRGRQIGGMLAVIMDGHFMVEQ